MSFRAVRRHTTMRSITDELQPLDEQAFGARVEPHRRELHVHCYRLLGSFEEAEDLVQEAFLRAWRRRTTYEGRASVRAWLYRIATNACLDALDKRPRRPSASGEVAWLQPYPDELLEQLPDRREGPEDVALANETIELAFIAAIQHLAPLPRAVLVLRDVLGCSAKETARLLETTEASVNSALQRARGGLRERLPEDREAWQRAAGTTAAERGLLARYVECSERADAAGLAALMHEDVRFSMPPTPGVWTGRGAVVQGWIDGGFGSEGFGSMRCVVTRANGQPAVAGYVRKPGDGAYEPLAIDVPAGAGRGRHRDRHLRRRGVRALRPAGHARCGMSVPTPITVTPVRVADLLAEGERMPVYVHVIEHPDARVLVDTGMTELHPAVADLDPRLRPLSEQDFDLAGVDIVVNTHLHFDHCGGNHLFAGRPIYVQRRELEDARSEEDYTIREWVDAPGVRYVPVDGELELLPGLRLLPAPGHSRGMQVVVVETGGRPVVVGGDVGVWFGELDEPSTEGQLRVRALDPELVWLAHEHEPWRPRTA